VQGLAENGGQVYVDVLVSGGIDDRTPFPALTVIDSPSYTRYSANPGWPYNAAGWYSAPSFYYKNCRGTPPPNPNVKHDCLNGNCIPAETYGTPGIYGNLASCEGGCAQNSPCEGECIPVAEIAALQQAVDRVRPRLCQ
jgi:hypothetical protein